MLKQDGQLQQWHSSPHHAVSTQHVKPIISYGKKDYNNIMKKIFFIVAISFVAILANAQKMIVYSLSGKIEVVTEGLAKPVRLRDAISPNTILNIPYQGCIVLLDENSSQQITL